MAKREPTYRQYRCEATLCDGSTAVLFAMCATPQTALELARDTWLSDDKRPVEIRIYGGGKTKAVGQMLVKWEG